MSWLAVDKDGCEHIFAEKPCRNIIEELMY